MKFRPLHDRVLIKVLDSEEKTAGGIIIPDTAKEKPQEGEVVAVGSGMKSDDGKIVLFTAVECNKYGIVKMLLNKGADANIKINDSSSPLPSLFDTSSILAPNSLLVIFSANNSNACERGTPLFNITAICLKKTSKSF